MNDQDKAAPYEVGYGKPPKRNQFRKGQSGNPKGKPKGTKNFATLIQDELKKKVVITEDGKRKAVTKCEVIVKQLVNKSMAGDLKAAPFLFNEIRPFDGANVNPEKIDEMSQEDRAVMQSILRRIREAQGLPSVDQSAAPQGDGSVASPAIPGDKGDKE